ncbi:MAG: hypothetical protein AB1393_01755 [Candidatus Edwardsbacteria bacterium]
MSFVKSQKGASTIGWLIFLVILGVAIHIGYKLGMPYLRYSNLKGKMEAQAKLAATESDTSIATTLSQDALENKIPLVGDFFSSDSKPVPTTEEEKGEYLKGAKSAFLSAINRFPGDSIIISLSYEMDVNFSILGQHLHKQHLVFQPRVAELLGK